VIPAPPGYVAKYENGESKRIVAFNDHGDALVVALNGSLICANSYRALRLVGVEFDAEQIVQLAGNEDSSFFALTAGGSVKLWYAFNCSFSKVQLNEM
jgi:hypothetical protein